MSLAIPPAALHGLSHRLGLIVIEGLCRLVAARGVAWRPLAPLMTLTWGRLRRLACRFEALLALLAAGRAPRIHPPRPRPASDPAAPPLGRPPGPVRHSVRLPRDVGWLIVEAPGAAVYASQLRHLLADPAMLALLAEVPRAARILRPLCRMLMLDPPPLPAKAPPLTAPLPAPLPVREPPPAGQGQTSGPAHAASPSAASATREPPGPSFPGRLFAPA